MITKEINGFKMHLNPDDGGISRVLAKKGQREPCFMWILEKEAEGELGLDIGANIGYTTLHLCRAMKKVIAIEPDPRSRELLTKNIQANNFAAKTDIFDFAVSDTIGERTIWLADKPNLTTLCERPGLEAKKRKILTRTIDSLNVKPNFIKMDIEGHEVEALRGAMQTLKEVKFCKILIEVHPMFFVEDSFEKVLRDLTGFGFKIKYVISAGVPRPDLFKKHGYKPVPGAPKNKRAIYNCITSDHAIKWSSYPIEQKCKRGKVSPKIVRAILLEKDQR